MAFKTAELQHPPWNQQPHRVCVSKWGVKLLLKYASCVKLRDDAVAKWAACTASQKLNWWKCLRWIPSKPHDISTDGCQGRLLRRFTCRQVLINVFILIEQPVRCFAHLQPGSQKYLMKTIIWSLQLAVITHTTFPAATCSTAHAVCTS